mmetsp:Transcript_23702/g.55225  ORF Transcript_23702/g.55225 Transcript_23702/m.55225 type:complete len:117 (+) Transcript_23702:859-1209(+)
MQNGTFAESLNNVTKLVYLSPIFFVSSSEPTRVDPPESKDASQTETPNGSTRTRPWAIGATSAIFAGGVVVLVAWLRGRRHELKTKEQMALSDDLQSSLPSMVSCIDTDSHSLVGA